MKAPPRNIRKRLWLILCIFLLLFTTPLAFIQMKYDLHLPAKYRLKRKYRILSPLVIPADSNLPYLNANITAVSHTEESLWVGGDNGFLAHSDDDGKTWIPIENPFLTKPQNGDTLYSVRSLEWRPDGGSLMLETDDTLYSITTDRKTGSIFFAVAGRILS